MAQLWTIRKESLQEKGTQSTNFIVQGVKATFILFKCHRSIDSSNGFYPFILLRKEFSHEILKPHCESGIMTC